MIQHGAAPYLECSSKGDNRFSAFYAKVKSRGFKSVENIYQGAKVLEDGSTGHDWRAIKGRDAVNMDQVQKLYPVLWDEYIQENPDLLPVLLESSGLSDMFGQVGHACQATELWRIRVEAMRKLVIGDNGFESSGDVVVVNAAPANARLVIDIHDPANGFVSLNIREEATSLRDRYSNYQRYSRLITEDLPHAEDIRSRIERLAAAVLENHVVTLVDRSLHKYSQAHVLRDAIIERAYRIHKLSPALAATKTFQRRRSF